MGQKQLDDLYMCTLLYKGRLIIHKIDHERIWVWMQWTGPQACDAILVAAIGYRTITQLSSCSGRWLMTVVCNNGVIN